VISPLLANIYLHYVFRPLGRALATARSHGRHDHRALRRRHHRRLRARDRRPRFLEAMRERLAEFALSLHPDKTRLIEFGRRAAGERKSAGLANRRPSTSSASPSSAAKRAGQVPAQAEVPARPHAGEAQGIKEELRRRMHQPIPDREMAEAGRHRLLQLPRGADQQSALAPSATTSPTSGGARSRRRSQKDRTTWERIEAAGRRLAPQTAHPSSLAKQRFAVKHPRWEPYAGIGHVRICAGGASNARPYRDSAAAIVADFVAEVG
jgi:RNA-directed DNA polymerase